MKLLVAIFYLTAFSALADGPATLMQSSILGSRVALKIDFTVPSRRDGQRPIVHRGSCSLNTNDRADEKRGTWPSGKVFALDSIEFRSDVVRMHFSSNGPVSMQMECRGFNSQTSFATLVNTFSAELEFNFQALAARSGRPLTLNGLTTVTRRLEVQSQFNDLMPVENFAGACTYLAESETSNYTLSTGSNLKLTAIEAERVFEANRWALQLNLSFQENRRRGKELTLRCPNLNLNAATVEQIQQATERALQFNTQ